MHRLTQTEIEKIKCCVGSGERRVRTIDDDDDDDNDDRLYFDTLASSTES